MSLTLCYLTRREYDVSGQEQAEEKPRGPEEGFSAIFELASGSAILGDAEGRVLRVNPKMCKITGYSEGELLGKTPADLGKLGARNDLYASMGVGTPDG